MQWSSKEGFPRGSGSTSSARAVGSAQSKAQCEAKTQPSSIAVFLEAKNMRMSTPQLSALPSPHHHFNPSSLFSQQSAPLVNVTWNSGMKAIVSASSLLVVAFRSQSVPFLKHPLVNPGLPALSLLSKETQKAFLLGPSIPQDHFISTQPPPNTWTGYTQHVSTLSLQSTHYAALKKSYS